MSDYDEPAPGQIEVAGYRLDKMIGRGGNGVVWSGHQTDTGSRVAIKFLRTSRPDKHHAFFSEAQALARLNHPGIVRILDIGTTRNGPFDSREESPYIVMEHVPGEPLYGRLPALAPRGIFEVLLGLLDVLSYAHARRIIHRDVKPSNVLLVPAGDGFDLRLVDFGLAFGTDDRHSTMSARIEGTPEYMAPEQIRGQHRETGPWTDLYAVGCVAWAMATGATPYHAVDKSDVLVGHLRGDLGPFEPRLALPDGFADWARRLLQRSPYRRFQRAVEARAALMQLDVPAGSWFRSLPEAGSSRASPSMTIVSEPPPTAQMFAEPGLDSWSAPSAALTNSIAVPADWRDVERVSPNWPSGPAHLRLFALREVELVGRERLRDALWAALLDVVESRSGRFVLLNGAYGVGKSRLARWLVERAHEASGAEVLVARHSAREHPAAGLARIATEALRCDGLRGESLESRVEDQLSRHGIRSDSFDFVSHVVTALLEDASPSSASAGTADGPGPGEQIAAVVEVVRAFARRRPVVVWLDDLHEAPTSARFARRLVEGTTDLPVLVIATSLEGRGHVPPSHVAGLVESLAERGRVVAVDRLPDRDIARLVQVLLDPDQDTLSRVVRRAGGSPLFAVELANEWAGSGALVAGPNGRLVFAGPDSTVPTGLQEIWNARLAASLEACAAEQTEARRALEVAAALGRQVSNDEWKQALNRLGVEPMDEVVRELVRRELVVALPEGWRFRHELLRNAIVERSQEAGRWASHHAICADVLEGMYPSDRRGIAARRAQHLLESNQYEDALEQLWIAFREIRVFGEIERCAQLLNEREVACDALGLEPNAYERVLNMLISSSVGRQYPEDGPFEGWFEHVAAISGRHGYYDLLARALRGLANLRLEAGDCDEAVRLYDESLASLDRDEGGGDQLDRMYALVQRGTALHRAGRTDEALNSMAEATAIARETGPMFEARTCFEMVTVALLDGRLDHARWLAEEAVGLARSARNQRIEGVLVGRLGDIERNDNNFDKAREHYTRVRQLQDSGVEVFRFDPRFKLAILDLAEGDRSALTRIDALSSTRREPVRAALDLLADDPARAETARAAIEAHPDGWLEFDVDAQFLVKSGLVSSTP